MGSVIGYLGKEGASNILLEKLAKVKFMGQDGLGIATFNGEEIRRVHSEKKFEQVVRSKNFRIKGKIGIGGIRFATHGRPTLENTAPFYGCNQNFAAISVGVIENFSTKKEALSEKGHIFKSRNDGEIIPHLFEETLNGNFIEGLKNMVKKLKGPFSFLLLTNKPSIIAYSQEGEFFLSQENEGKYIASDSEILESPYRLEKGKIGILKPEKIQIYDLSLNQLRTTKIKRSQILSKSSVPQYENFMIREIYNQPKALKRALVTSQEKYVDLIARMIIKGGELFLTGCGTSYHAARLGGYLFRQISEISPSVVNAAEFRYYTLKDLEPGGVIIAISQSGKTTDLLRTVRDAKRYGASIIGILNHLATPLMYSSNLYLPMGVGEENAVPATKSFLGSLIALYKITIKVAEKKQINSQITETMKNGLKKLPQLIQETIENTEPVIEEISHRIKNKTNMFVLGRGIDLPVALEGSLKLKEAAKIHSEAMTAGELRHGSMTLLEKNFPAIFLIPNEKDAQEDTYTLISEVNEIGGESILVTQETDVKAERVSDMVIKIPKTSQLLSPFVKIVPLQLLSYKIGNVRGIKVDKPKALSKSVILEE